MFAVFGYSVVVFDPPNLEEMEEIFILGAMFHAVRVERCGTFLQKLKLLRENGVSF